MKELNFNKKSWHYFFYSIVDEKSENYNDYKTDLCSYIKGVVQGIFLVILFIVVGIALVGGSLWVIGTFFWSIFQTIYHLDFVYLNNPVMMIFATFLSLGVILFVLVTISEARQQKKFDKFVPAVYRKFKDKTCVMINLKD